MILFTIVTSGLYVPMWFLRRRAGLNRLNSDRKLRAYPFVGVFILLFIVFAVAFIVGFTRDETLVPSAEALTSLVKVAMTVILVVQAFFVKEILEDHLTDELKATPIPGTNFGAAQKVSTILTFFLGIFYLQYVINRQVA
jgi:hypothetical protein